MKQQKHYIFLQKQILLMIFLSLIPGLIYVYFGWVFDLLLPSLLWYISLILMSLYGFFIYRHFSKYKMNETQLRRWYMHLRIFLYTIFTSWVVIFAINIQNSEYNLHYIAIFTELGASVVASALLVSDKKLFAPILITLMLPLSLYFFLLGTWYGYVLSLFSVIFLGVLLYAAFNTNMLIEKNYYQAQHDMLTGLHNRRYFIEYMQSLNDRLIEHNTIAYMYLIDLDHFKNINDSLGHDIGDELLIQVANRIKNYSNNTHMLARLGGDEFMLIDNEVIDKNIDYEAKAYRFANDLLAHIRKEYILNQHHLHISASIGINKINFFNDSMGTYIKEVDIAMYEAKSRGRDGVIVFNKDLSKKVSRDLDIEQQLYKALHTNGLSICYQAQFDALDRLAGCEALVRWTDDKKLGVVSPDEFIPIAENTGLILELGFYVLSEVFKVLYDWHKKENVIPSFSINISIRQLLCEAFIEEVEVLCKDYFLKTSMKQTIVFEITEHVFSENISKVAATMNRLKHCGIIFSIDDFGTGYSSLSYLQKLPIDELKIDKSFILDMQENTYHDTMISTIVSIAKNFDLNVVAEGIEKKEQYERLKNHGCKMYQGFYFDEALSKEAFELKYFKD
jgi:diguanylate cyclase (GGDEF)-like protein